MNFVFKSLALMLCFSLTSSSFGNKEAELEKGEDVREGFVTDEAYMDFEQDGRRIGRIIIGLFGYIVPVTVENFLTFINGTNADGDHYKGSEIHRVIKEFVIQGGDFVNRNGTGSKSAFNSRYFDDENFMLKNRGGMIGMANLGRHTNGNQFYILLLDAPWLDGSHVVFAKVLSGMDVVKKMGSVPTDQHDKPLSPIFISDCGFIPVDRPYEVIIG